MRTIDKIVTKVSGKYGAPLGRSNRGTRPTDPKVKIYDCAVPLIGYGDYDRGGVYWGIGSQLRVSYTKDLSYVQFYRANELPEGFPVIIEPIRWASWKGHTWILRTLYGYTLATAEKCMDLIKESESQNWKIARLLN
jgi:hypothetical protein